jgi:hypothetical protein
MSNAVGFPMFWQTFQLPSSELITWKEVLVALIAYISHIWQHPGGEL